MKRILISLINKLLTLAQRYLPFLKLNLFVYVIYELLNRNRIRKIGKPFLSIDDPYNFKQVKNKADLFNHFNFDESQLIWIGRPSYQINVAKNDFVIGKSIFGKNIPRWIMGKEPYSACPTYSVKFKNSYLFPSWGAIMPVDGVFFEPSVNAARYKSPDLSQLPGVFLDKDRSLKVDLKKLNPLLYSGYYLLLNHWGSINYGHFIFDSLPGVILYHKEILQGKIKIITCELKNWQREFLSILRIPKESIIEVKEPLCICENLIYPSFLNDNLNKPNHMTVLVRNSLIKCIANLNIVNDKLIYISRKNYNSRKMVNEDELINELSKFGFIVLQPENYSIQEQIILFSQAKIIIGEIGAGLSNILFAPRGTKVIEIMPEIKPSQWIKRLCGLLDMEWYCIYANVPKRFREISIIEGVKYTNLFFRYVVDVEDVLTAFKNTIKLN